MKRSSRFSKFLLIAPLSILAFLLPDESMGQPAPAFQSDDFSASDQTDRPRYRF